MKRTSKIFIVLLNIVAIFLITNSKNVIVTESKEYKAANDNNVSTRELAMLASLVYEDVPDDSRYTGTTANIGCNVDNNSGNINGKCHYVALEGESASNLKLKGSMFNIWQYVEGLSERKMHSVVSAATSAFREDGQTYYFLNFAFTEEMEKWDIVHYGSRVTTTLAKKAGVDFDWDGEFYAITFKKGNNYVIAYRGTDYPDLFEWAEDVGYSLNGEHPQAKYAYTYAQSEYERILKENPNANIYVTGHSLGAYLAQVGGAAIIDAASGYNDSYRQPKTLNNLGDYSEEYNSAPNLKQVAYFNGMGVGGMFSTLNFTKNIDNALVYLSTHNTDGSIASKERTVNYSSDIGSSGRLVLYSMDADPVSDIGIHFGEIYKLEVGADAISNHHQQHNGILPVGQVLQVLFKVVNLGNNVEQFINKKADEIISELEKMYDNKYIDSVSNNLYSLIRADSIGKIDDPDCVFKFLPDFVLNAISNQNNGKSIVNYGLLSLLSNLSKDVKTFSNKYDNIEITNLFDHFNMNHETDSFACLIDNENGKVDKITLNAESYKMNYDGNKGIFYTNKLYSDGIYKFGKDTKTISKTTNSILLRAEVVGACAKKYEWFYSTDNITFTSIGETIRNEILIPEEYFNFNTEGSKTLYFKAKISYGDKYQETKLVLPSDTATFKYEKTGNVKSINPTLNDGLSEEEETERSAETNSLKITVVYDKTSPSCYFVGNSKTIKLETGIFGIGKETKSNINFICKDELSGIDTNVNDYDNFDLDENTFPLGFPLVKLDKSSGISKSENGNKVLSISIPVIGLRKPAISKYHAVLEYNGGYTDRAGNRSKSSKINIYVTK